MYGITSDCSPHDGFKFEPVLGNGIPPAARNGLVFRAGLYVRIEQAPESVEEITGLTVCKLPSGFLAFSGVVDKVYIDATTETTVQIVQTDELGTLAGVGEIRYSPNSQDDYFHEKPFVGTTNTAKCFQRQGLGRERLLYMGALCRKRFNGLFLHSDTNFVHPSARTMWDDLVSSGDALRYDQVTKSGKLKLPRYRFVRDTSKWPTADHI